MNPNKGRNRNWFFLSAIGFIALGLVLLFLFGFPKPSESLSQALNGDDLRSEPAPVEDAIAPDFKLFNLDSEEVHLGELNGQPVLINFWATWCAPCRIEMPAIQNRYEKFAEDGLVVLAVNFDEPKENVLSFAEEFGLTFEVLLDPGGEIQRSYRIRGYPTSFFIDSNGVIRVLHIGLMTEGQMDGYLAEIGLES